MTISLVTFANETTIKAPCPEELKGIVVLKSREFLSLLPPEEIHGVETLVSQHDLHAQLFKESFPVTEEELSHFSLTSHQEKAEPNKKTDPNQSNYSCSL